MGLGFLKQKLTDPDSLITQCSAHSSYYTVNPASSEGHVPGYRILSKHGAGSSIV